MNLRSLFLLVILLFSTMVGCTNKPSFETAEYTDRNFGISFTYPKDWYLENEGDKNLFLVYVTKDQTSIFKSEFGMFVQGSRQEGAGRQLIRKHIDDIRVYLNDNPEIKFSEKKVTLSGKEAVQLNMEGVHESTKESIYSTVFYIEEPDLTLLLRYGISDPKDEAYLQIFKDIVSSIKIT